MRARLRTAPLALAVALALVVPATAGASTAALSPEPPFPEDNSPSPYDIARYSAAPGEANDLSVTVTFTEEPAGFKSTVTFVDPGATIHAGAGCTSLGPHKAQCKSAGNRDIFDVISSLGDRNDHFRTTYGISSANGGPGDDVLEGSDRGGDVLNGGGGRDRLLGHDGGDTLNDGDRDGKRAGAGGPNADFLDGGPGEDTVSYAGRKKRVRVDLARGGPAGEKGEGDVVRSVANLTGGKGDDRLAGDDGDNNLEGGPGDDVLLGRGGENRLLFYADRLVGGSGNDLLDGGIGNDALAPGRGRDRLRCSLGVEGVTQPAGGEVLDRCEGVTWSWKTADGDVDLSTTPLPLAYGRRLSSVRFGLSCPDDSEGEQISCAGTLTIRTAFGKRRRLGRARFSRERGSGDVPPAVRVRLNRTGRRLLRRRHGVVATMSVRGRGFKPPIAWTTRLKRGRVAQSPRGGGF